MLKFENTAEIGDRIRAYDFEPMPGRNDCFVEGVITDKGWIEDRGYKAYTIKCDADSWPEGRRVDDTIYVPFGTSIMDWDGRVIKV